jgi:hypothetical protein
MYRRCGASIGDFVRWGQRPPFRKREGCGGDEKGDALTGVPLKTAEKPFGFFGKRIAVIGAQIPHLQPEKYFLSRIYRKRK